MKWTPWSRKGSRESTDAFTPIVAAGEREESLMEPSASLREPYVSTWSRSWSPQRACASRTSRRGRSSAGSERTQSQSRPPILGALYRHTPSGRSLAGSERTQSQSRPSRQRSSKAIVYPFADLPQRSRSNAFVRRQPEHRRALFSEDVGRSLWRSCDSPAMTMDTFFSTVSARMESDIREDTQAELKKASSEKPSRSTDNKIMHSSSVPPARWSDAQASGEKPPRSTSNKIMPSSSVPPTRRSDALRSSAFKILVSKFFTKPPANHASANLAEPSRHEAEMQEPGDIQRPMTQAEIQAWKAKNRAGRRRRESEEGIDRSARSPPLPARTPRGCVALGEHASRTQASAEVDKE